MSKDYKKSSGYRSRKRHFCGNQYSNKSKPDSYSGKSSTAKKQKLSSDTYSSFIDSEFLGYRIIDFNILSKEITQFVSCKVCGGDVKLFETRRCGLASTFEFQCSSCLVNQKFSNSRLSGIKKNIPEINKRVIYAMRCIGQGLGGLSTFCSVMDLPPPVSQKSYDKTTNIIRRATTVVAKDVMKRASTQEVEETDGQTDITISGDGTWKRRGHTSKVGVCSVIGAETGKVLDVEVLSTFCKVCDTAVGTVQNHDCLKNHSGSSGQMEVVGMCRIFERSQLNGVRYVNYIGDADSSTYPQLSASFPYGNDVPIRKIECVGHVQKRMGTGLRQLKAKNKEKLADGKTLGGKGRLTDKLIDKLTVYYGNAIRANKSSAEDMRKAIWAVYCHTASTDKEPMHFFCPTGENSWCKYQKFHATMKEEAKSKIVYKHEKTIPTEVMKKVKEVFTRLSAPDLLKRCLGGHTQNPNESFNSVVWKFCPKTSGSGKKICEIAVNEAVISFNEGNRARLQTLAKLGFHVSEFSVKSAEKADEIRLKKAEKKADLSTLEARRAKRRQMKVQEENLLLKEGVSYSAGKF